MIPQKIRVFQSKTILRVFLMRIFFIFFVLFSLSPESFAIPLNVKRALTDADYLELIRPRFMALKELQIAGSHLRGNKTVKKNGEPGAPEELDASILIVNPDQDDHAMDNESLLGIIGSGFDMELMRDLLALCQKLDHRFEKVYINNFWPSLPIPGDLPDNLSRPQLALGKFNSEGEEAWRKFKNFLAICFYVYVARVEADPVAYGDAENFGLYSVFGKLLKPQGKFLFKSGSFPELNTIFHMGFLDFKSGTRPQKVKKSVIVGGRRGTYELDRDTEASEKDEKLRQRIELNLLRPLSSFYLKPSEYGVNADGKVDLSAEKNSRWMIRQQIRLLELSGFTHFSVGFGYLKSWGWLGEDTSYGYSMIIQAIHPE